MKYWQIGFNKSGTTALAMAMRKLGMSVAHGKTNFQGEFLRTNFNCENFRQYDAFVEWQGWHALMREGWDAIKLIANKFPDDKFIFTRRDKEDWILSSMTHVMYNRAFTKSRWNHINTRELEHSYETTSNKFMDYFSSDRMLIIDIPGGEGWGKLCPFLGVDIPSGPFPRANESHKRLRRLLERAESKEPTKKQQIKLN
jgi:hypothetical protein